MGVIDAIYGRRAIREYSPELVGETQLRTLIDAAVQAPSAEVVPVFWTGC